MADSNGRFQWNSPREGDRLVRTASGYEPSASSQCVGREIEAPWIAPQGGGLEQVEVPGCSLVPNNRKFMRKNGRAHGNFGASRTLLLSVKASVLRRTPWSDHAGVLLEVGPRSSRATPVFPTLGAAPPNYASGVANLMELRNAAAEPAWGHYSLLIRAIWEVAHLALKQRPKLIDPRDRLQAVLQLVGAIFRGPKDSSHKERYRWQLRIISLRGSLSMGQDEIKLTLDGRDSGVGALGRSGGKGKQREAKGDETLDGKGWTLVRNRKGKEKGSGTEMGKGAHDKGRDKDEKEDNREGYQKRREKRRKASGEKVEDEEHYNGQHRQIDTEGKSSFHPANNKYKHKLLRITSMKNAFGHFVSRLHGEAIMQHLAEIKDTEERMVEEWKGERKNVTRRRDQTIPGKWNLYDTVENQDGQGMHDPEEAVKEVGK